MSSNLDPITAAAQQNAERAYEAKQPMDKGEVNVAIVTIVAMAILFSFGLCCAGLEFTGYTHLSLMHAIEYVAAPIIGGAILTAAIVGLIYLFGDKTLKMVKLPSQMNDPLSDDWDPVTNPHGNKSTTTEEDILTDNPSFLTN